MTQAAWSKLHLLRIPNGTSPLSKVRGLLTDIMVFATAAKGSETAWRGHTSSDYKLCPSAARNGVAALSQPDLTKKMDQLLADAHDASRFWRDGREFEGLSELERLALLQHHISGTALLDITPDPLVALWMACQPCDDGGSSKNGLLIGLNNWNWTDYSGQDTSYGDVIAQETTAWFQPRATSDRAVVQRSRFLVPAMASKQSWSRKISDISLPRRPAKWSQKKLDNIFDAQQGKPAQVPLVAFLVPQEIKSTALDVLKGNFGIQRDSIYPDIDGMKY